MVAARLAKASCSLPASDPARAMPARSPGHEYRNAGRGEPFGQNLKGHGLAGSGGPGDQPVAVAIPEKQFLRQRVAFTTAARKNSLRGQFCLHVLPLIPETLARVWPEPDLQYILNPTLPVLA